MPGAPSLAPFLHFARTTFSILVRAFPWLLLILVAEFQTQTHGRALAAETGRDPILLASASATGHEPAAMEPQLTVPSYFNQGNDLVFKVSHPRSNVTYELQFTTNLSSPANWRVLQRGLPGQTNFVIANPRTLQGFFRLRVPHLVAPRMLTVPEDQSVSLTGIRLSGFDGFSGSLSLSVSNGSLELIATNKVLLPRSNGRTVLTLTGTEEDLNSALRNVRYQGNTNYYGPDTLTIFLTSAGPGRAIAETAQVGIIVTPVNDPPEAGPDYFSITEDLTLFVPAPGVLSNDHDVEGDPLSAAMFSGPTHGLVSFHPDGSFSYQPEANFNGTDSFTYRPTDGASDGNVATVTITVLPANDAPQVSLTNPPNGAAIAAGTIVTLAVAAFDHDGIIVRVEYLSDSNVLGAATSAPFTFAWQGATLGNHILTARAIDDSGAVGISPPVAVTVSSDCDGDGVSDAFEALNGTDPCDFFNGIPPVLIPIGGNYQSGSPGTVLPQPLILQVANADGVLRSNLPVTFTVTEGGSMLSSSTNGPWAASLNLNTENDGTAAAHVRLPRASAVLSLVNVSAGAASNLAQVTFAESTAGPVDGWVLQNKPVAISAGGQHTLALLADGTVLAWGRNTEGQLGNGITVPYSSTPLPVPGVSNVTAIAAGAWHSLALLADGTVAAWGQYLENYRTTPPARLSGVVAIAAGTGHSLALLSDGTVRAWGDPFTNYSPPDALTEVTALAAGHGFSLALRANGTIVAWGISAYDDDYGQTRPPAGLTGVRAIAAGSYHGLALLANGNVVAWGLNNFGQTDVPSSVVDAVAVAAGASLSLALQADGTVVAWGDLSSTTFDSLSALRGVVTITAGGLNASSHSAALESDGTVWSWGANNYGQLGNGSQTTSTIPVPVTGLPPASTTTNEVNFQVYTPLE